jgi:hypothetical protein
MTQVSDVQVERKSKLNKCNVDPVGGNAVSAMTARSNEEEVDEVTAHRRSVTPISIQRVRVTIGVRKVSALSIDTKRVLIGISRSTPKDVNRKMSIWAEIIDQISIHVQSRQGKAVSIERGAGCRTVVDRRGSNRRSMTVHGVRPASSWSRSCYGSNAHKMSIT